MYPYDAAQACDRIVKYTRGTSRADYLADDQLRSAVERQLTIVGEAMGQALRCDPSLRDAITDPDGPRELRNLLVHGYGQIEDDRILTVIESDLPLLRTELRALLGDDDPAAGAGPEGEAPTQ